MNRQGRCTWVANGRLSVVRGPVVPGGCPGGSLGLAVLVGGKSQWDLSMGLVISSGGCGQIRTLATVKPLGGG